MAEVKSKLKRIYTRDCSWISAIPWLSDEKTMKSCFLLGVQTKGRSSVVDDAKNIFVSGERRILLRNESNFGKSALCAYLTQQWVQNKLNNFDLCLYIDLKNKGSLRSVYDMAIGNCSVARNNRQTSCSEVEKVLLKNSEKILVILDNLNGIDEQTQKEVEAFLTLNSVFTKSTVMLASRPVHTDRKFLLFFEKHVHIIGLNFNQMAKRVDSGRFEVFYRNAKVFFLTGFPPQYIFGTLQSFKRGVPQNANLFDLLDNIFKLTVRRHHFTETMTETIYCKLGKYFHSALLNGSNSIEVETFKSCFGENCRFLLDLGIFILKEDSAVTKLVSPKILMVFFTTLYLRSKWDKTKDSEKHRLLEEYFTCGDTIADYVFDTSGDTKPLAYLVGILPEVVLKVAPDCDPLFVMYHETEPLELSSAFDSVNLLLRVEDKFLGRFGFEIPTKSSLENAFSDIIACLEFDECSVKLKYFSNEQENRVFLTANVVDQSGLVAMQLVVVKDRHRKRTSSQIQYEQLHLTFSFTNYETIERFLKSVLPQKCVDEIFLGKSSEMGEFIFSLVEILARVDGKRMVHVEVNGRGNDSGKKYHAFSFDVKADSVWGCHIWFAFQTLNPLRRKEHNFCLEDFFVKKDTIKSIVNACAFNMEEPYVTVHLK